MKKHRDPSTQAKVLRQSERKHSDLADNIGDGVYRLNKDGYFTFVNKVIADRSGFSPEKFYALHFIDIVAPEDQERVTINFEKVMKGEAVTPYELSYRISDGRMMIVEINTNPIYEKGKIIGLQGISRDVTERKQAEKALGESENKYRDLYDFLPISIVEIDTKGTIISFNRKSLEVFRYKQEDFKEGMTALQFFESSQLERLEVNLQRIIDGTSIPGQEFLLLRKDGSTFPGLIYASTIIQASKIVGIRAAIIDITERKRVEDALRQECSLRNAFIGNVTEGLCVCHETTEYPFVKFTIWNDRMTEITGYTLDEINRLGWYQTVYSDPELQTKAMERMKKMRQGDDLFGEEWEIIRADGNKRVVTISSSIIESDDGTPHVLALMQDITDRKQAEKALRESEEKYRQLAETAHDTIVTVDLNFKVMYVNKATLNFFGGINPVGMSLLDFTPPHMRQLSEVMMQKRREGFSDMLAFEWEIVHPTGKIATFDIRATLLTEDKKPSGVMFVARDITDRNQVEKALRDSEEKYRILVENANDIIYRTDAQGCINFFNAATVKFTGHAEADLIGKHFSDLIRPDCRAEAERFYGRQFVKNIPSTYYEVPLLTGDKREAWLGQHVQLIIDDGQVVGFHAIARDITERRRAEMALRESEERYRTILNDMEEGYQEVDIAGNFTFFNEAFLKIFGYSRDEMMGTNFSLYAAEEEIAKKVYRVYNQMYKTGIPVKSFQWDITRKDGARRTLEFFASLLRDSNDRPIGFRGIVRDATEHKHAEEKLKDSESRYQFLAESMADVVFTLDLNMATTYVSPSIERMLGFTPEERMVQKVDQQLTPKSQELAFETLVAELDRDKEKNVDLNRSQTLELEYYHKDGSIKHLATYIRGIRDREGHLTGFYGAHHDITERRRSEMALRESESTLSSLFRAAPIGIGLVVNRIVKRVNDRICEMVGYAREEIIDKSARLFYPTDEDFEFVGKEKYGQISKRGTGAVETVWKHKDGRIMDILLSSTPLSPSDLSAGVTFTALDITERKQAELELRKSFERLRKTLGATVQAIAVTVETRDPYTAGHQRRVADLSRAIATEMGLATDQIDGLRMAGIIHDLGKISVPAEILSKPTKLTNLEFGLIKIHAQSGYDILKDIEFPWPIARMVLEHHERMDGSGYPNGLTGDELLIESRILTVADVAESMASHRPYRPALGLDVALDEITKNKNILYDPEVVDACLRLFYEKGYKLEG